MVWDWASTFIFLPAISKSGRKEIFEIRVEGVPDPDGDAWFYYAKPKDWKVTEGEEYFASFKTIAAGLLQLEGVTNRLPAEFQGFGITAALIPHVAESHAARIQSSRHRPSNDRKSTRLNSSHGYISHAAFCFHKKNTAQ